MLLAEDDEHDVFFMQRAFGRAGVTQPIMAVNNGQEAIQYLHGEGNFADRSKYPAPRLVLLDLKMPLVDGFEVLSWIREQPGLREWLPVLVLSSSAQEADVKKALALGAHEYLVKPGDFNSLVGLVEEIKRRWLDAAPAPAAKPVARD